MRKQGLRLHHTVLAAIALSGAAWAFAQQAAPAAPAKPAPAARPAPSKKALDKPLWRELSRAQQVALQPLAAEWDQMDGVRKKKWLEMANKFASMKPEEQQRVHERMRDWVKLTPAQRKLARDTYTRTKKLEPGQKAATWESYQQLPEEQKKKLAAQRKQKPAAPRAAGTQPRVAACPAGTVKNTAAATPPCVAVPAAAPVQPPAAQPVATPPPSTTPPAPNAQ